MKRNEATKGRKIIDRTTNQNKKNQRNGKPNRPRHSVESRPCIGGTRGKSVSTSVISKCGDTRSSIGTKRREYRREKKRTVSACST